MSDDEDFSAEEVWDEYDWERFLQQQDRNTEKYFGLLEKFMDHPERDAIIAREMGWDDSDDDHEIEEVAEFLCEQETPEETGPTENDFDEFSRSPIYRDTLKLHRWINAWIDEDDRLKDHPEAIRLATRSAICGAKLAAALCGDDCAEIGMTIAYLKRALKAANDSLDAAANLAEAGLLTGRQPATVRRLIFRIRDRVISLMSDYRAEWRKRHG
jgi:hypothetical protein